MKLAFLPIFVAGALIGGQAALAQDEPPSRVARLNYLGGAVSFQPVGVDDWVPAVVNRPLTTGDRLWVGDNSRAELHIGSTALHLDEHTGFSFLNLDDRTAQIRLSQGTLEIRLRSLDEAEIFEVDTPNLSFTLQRPGEYRIDVGQEGDSTNVTAFSGEGEAVTAGQTFAVRAGEQARVSGVDSPAYDIGGAPVLDRFDDWCAERDRREDGAESARYVSRDMDGYEDLDQYGYWTEMPPYGPVWRPRAVSPGWAPYRYGHWVWIAPWGWTWVDDAPWGFAPFHYGRWVSVSGGWGWVPGPMVRRPVYSPALVAWVGGPNFSVGVAVGGGPRVGWFPLGPGEPYAPAWRAGRGPLANVNVNYVNRTHATVVSRDIFVGARPVGASRIEMPRGELDRAQVVHSVGVTPDRYSRLGRSTIAPNVARPPAAVMNRRVVERSAPASRRNVGPEAVRPQRNVGPEVVRPQRNVGPEVVRPQRNVGPETPRSSRDVERQRGTPPAPRQVERPARQERPTERQVERRQQTPERPEQKTERKSDRKKEEKREKKP